MSSMFAVCTLQHEEKEAVFSEISYDYDPIGLDDAVDYKDGYVNPAQVARVRNLIPEKELDEYPVINGIVLEDYASEDQDYPEEKVYFGTSDNMEAVLFDSVDYAEDSSPSTLLHAERFDFYGYDWIHESVLGQECKMCCDYVASEHLWIKWSGLYFRINKVAFVSLACLSMFGPWKLLDNSHHWGHPEQLVFDQGITYNELYEPEKFFQTLEELEADWRRFKKNPDPDYTEFCNDIFGSKYVA